MPDTDENGALPKTLAINYIKTEQYREASCDGALGGVTSKNKIWMALYSERYPLPRVVVYKTEPSPDDPKTVSIDESTSAPIAVESKEGLIRNVEFGAYMNLEVAIALHKWLGQRIDQLSKGTK